MYLCCKNNTTIIQRKTANFCQTATFLPDFTSNQQKSVNNQVNSLFLSDFKQDEIFLLSPIMPTYICILAPWSSGSSALAGFFHHCGAHTCPPHLFSNDERTLNTFESIVYRNQLHELIKIEFPDKDTCSFQPSTKRGDFEDFFSKWIQSQSEIANNLNKTHIVLKHALQTFALNSITKFIEPKFIVLERPVEEIEKTRMRRNWTAEHGKLGAMSIYSETRDYFDRTKTAHFPVSFDEFRKKEKTREDLLKFCEMSPRTDQLANANSFLR